MMGGPLDGLVQRIHRLAPAAKLELASQLCVQPGCRELAIAAAESAIADMRQGLTEARVGKERE